MPINLIFLSIIVVFIVFATIAVLAVESILHNPSLIFSTLIVFKLTHAFIISFMFSDSSAVNNKFVLFVFICLTFWFSFFILIIFGSITFNLSFIFLLSINVFYNLWVTNNSKRSACLFIGGGLIAVPDVVLNQSVNNDNYNPASFEFAALDPVDRGSTESLLTDQVFHSLNLFFLRESRSEGNLKHSLVEQTNVLEGGYSHSFSLPFVANLPYNNLVVDPHFYLDSPINLCNYNSSQDLLNAEISIVEPNHYGKFSSNVFSELTLEEKTEIFLEASRNFIIE